MKCEYSPSSLNGAQLYSILNSVMLWNMLWVVFIQDFYAYVIFCGLKPCSVTQAICRKSFLWGAITRFLPSLRKEIVCYLGRPDHKQEFVSQWQQNYNAIPAHLISEDVMKAELHHRVDVSIWCNMLRGR